MSQVGTDMVAIRGTTLMRAAEAMLRALGGTEVSFLFPIASTDNNAELGMGEVPVQEVKLAPVCCLPAARQENLRRLEFLIPASALTVEMEARGSGSAQAWFESAVGILFQGRLLRIENVTSETFAGTAYLYRVTAVE